MLAFGKATTDKIVVACKKRGTTVMSTVHASVAGTNYSLANKRDKDKDNKSTIRFALRPYLPEPYSTLAYAAGLYATSWMKRVESGSPWRAPQSIPERVPERGHSGFP